MNSWNLKWTWVIPICLCCNPQGVINSYHHLRYITCRKANLIEGVRNAYFPGMWPKWRAVLQMPHVNCSSASRDTYCLWWFVLQMAVRIKLTPLLVVDNRQKRIHRWYNVRPSSNNDESLISFRATLVYRPSWNASAAVTANRALTSPGRWWRDSRPRFCSRAYIPEWHPQNNKNDWVVSKGRKTSSITYGLGTDWVYNIHKCPCDFEWWQLPRQFQSHFKTRHTDLTHGGRPFDIVRYEEYFVRYWNDWHIMQQQPHHNLDIPLDPLMHTNCE